MTTHPIPHTSADITADRLDALRSLIPEAFTEGRIDWDKLRAALGHHIDTRPDRYTFTWAGKQDAIRLLQTPTAATLVPAKDESLDWDTTQHLFIEGDNLEVLKLLYKAYYGRVKMIYIDPPYNTGNDFIYPDNYADPLAPYLQLTGQMDAAGTLLTSNPETSGRYHSAWLNMMYPRLFVARQLLSDDGVVLVSVDDHEIFNLRMALNEVFGEENFVECFIWKKSYGGGAKEKYAVTQHEYVLLYARNFEGLHELWLPPDPEAEQRYYRFQDDRGPYRIKPLEATKSMDRRENLVFPIPLPEGGEILPSYQWWWSKDRVAKALENNEIVFTRSGDSISVSYKQYLYDEEGNRRGKKPFSLIDNIYTQRGTADLRAIFDDQVVVQFPKPVDLMKELVHIGSEDNDGCIILDFFAGSCTMAQAALELNTEDDGSRRYIMVQLPEPTDGSSIARQQGFDTIADIGKERIRRVVARIKAEDQAQLDLSTRDTPEDLGFRVFKLAPSHFANWAGATSPTPADYTGQMDLFTDPLHPGWQPEAVIWEVAIKEGFSLTSRIETAPVAGHVVYRVADPDKDQHFHICLDDPVTPAIVAALQLAKDDLFICRDSALDDTAAANLALQCRLKTI